MPIEKSAIRDDFFAHPHMFIHPFRPAVRCLHSDTHSDLARHSSDYRIPPNIVLQSRPAFLGAGIFPLQRDQHYQSSHPIPSSKLDNPIYTKEVSTIEHTLHHPGELFPDFILLLACYTSLGSNSKWWWSVEGGDERWRSDKASSTAKYLLLLILLEQWAWHTTIMPQWHMHNKTSISSQFIPSGGSGNFIQSWRIH